MTLTLPLLQGRPIALRVNMYAVSMGGQPTGGKGTAAPAARGGTAAARGGARGGGGRGGRGGAGGRGGKGGASGSKAAQSGAAPAVRDVWHYDIVLDPIDDREAPAAGAPQQP